MNRAETYDLLTAIALVDNRKFDDATVLMWFQILGHVDPVDAGQAVAEHFRSSDAYLMPVHIARLADSYADQRARAERRAIRVEVVDPAPAVAPEERSPAAAEAIAAMRESTPAGNPDKLRWGTRFWRKPRSAEPARAFVGWEQAIGGGDQ